ncbi:MAG: hypothetical protein H6Q90_4450 [Deltaproteobacteria bacterium]|nr:hypothetical protein [Deltaproteobacteria bacterium]
MNAVVYIAERMPVAAIRRLAGLRAGRFERGGPASLSAGPAPRALDNDEAVSHVIARWGDDLCGLLNALSRGELAEVARTLRLDADAASKSWELRAALWRAGARLERGNADVPSELQPQPVVLGGHLVIQASPRGTFPASESWPRALPAPVVPAPPPEEPDTLDELLGAADRAIGVRLGVRGRDKGAWGMRAQALLGIPERGGGEPDWRGDVEIKTVPIARDLGGSQLWRVVEDPAIAMVGEPTLAKLQRTLWLARADVGDGDATIVSWYLLEWDAQIAQLARRYLHVRPKGPAGTDARGHYLSKRFFADAGMLATLNGWSA